MLKEKKDRTISTETGGVNSLPPSPAKWGSGEVGDTEKDASSPNYFNVSFWSPSINWFDSSLPEKRG